MSNKPVQVYPCRQCGRKFVPESLAKHEPICAKAAKKKRKTFNSMKQRLAETGVSVQQAERALKRPDPQVKPRGGGWRREHQEFISAIRAAKMMTIAEKTGKPLPASFYKQQVPSAPREDLVLCPHCNRRFNDTAAERHIPFCKQLRERGEGRADKQQKLAARTQFKPPPPAQKTQSAAPAPKPVPQNRNGNGTGPSGYGNGNGNGYGNGSRNELNGSGFGGGVTGNSYGNGGGGAGGGSYAASYAAMRAEATASRPAGRSGAPSGSMSQSKAAAAQPLGRTSYTSSNTVNPSGGNRMGGGSSGGPPGRSSVGSGSSSLSQSMQPGRAAPARTAGMPPTRTSASQAPVNATMSTYETAAATKSSRPAPGPGPGARTGATPPKPSGARKAAVLQQVSGRFCHECGSSFATSQTKFCMDCGARRLTIS